MNHPTNYRDIMCKADDHETLLRYARTLSPGAVDPRGARVVERYIGLLRAKARLLVLRDVCGAGHDEEA